MSPYRRNVIVGLTVLIAMVILGWMILQFGGSLASPFTAKQQPIRLVTDRADGISDGSPVVYRGVMVGRVAAVRRGADNLTVYIDALIDVAPPLPANLDAKIRTQGLIGSGAAIVLEVHPPDAAPQGSLAPGTELQAKYVGLDLLPPELSQLAAELRDTTRRLRESGLIENLNQQITKAGKVLDSTDQLLNDPKLRGDLTASLANLRDVSDGARRITGNLEQFTANLQQLSGDTREAIAQARGTIEKTEGHIDRIAVQFNERVAQTAELLDRFQSIAAKIDQGQGTAGQLVNDPRLYESLVLTAEQLNVTIKDLKRLVEQWEQEGVSFKLR